MGDEYWKLRALAMIVGVLITAVVVMTIKFTVRRRRPEGEWGMIYRSTDPHSFPSGHAARAFMLAVIMLGMGPGWLGLGLILWAVLVSLARVAMGVHYISDILVGWLIGLCLGMIVTRFF
jgi:undecaprenyl-diphosphatase